MAEGAERQYLELANCMGAKDDKGVRRVYRELLDLGRSRQEIVSEITRLLENKPRTPENLPNLQKPEGSTAPNPGEYNPVPTNWPEVAPQFSSGAAIQRGPLAKRTKQGRPDRKNPRISSSDQRNQTRVNTSIPSTSVRCEAQTTNPAPGEAQEIESVSASLRKTTSGSSAAPAETITISSDKSEKFEDKRDRAATTDTGIASANRENLAGNFLANIPPRQAPVNLDADQSRVPERLASKLRWGLHTQASTKTVKETHNVPASSARSSSPGWHRSRVGAVRILTMISILVVTIGVVLYRNEHERATAGITRTLVAWFKQVGNAAPSPRAEPAIVSERRVKPEKSEAVETVLDPAKSETESEEVTPSIKPVPAASNSRKLGERSVEAVSVPPSSEDLGKPGASLAGSHPTTPNPAGLDETKEQVLRPELPDSNTAPPENLSRKPTSSKSGIAAASDTVEPTSTDEASELSKSKPPQVSPADQKVTAIITAGLIERGDQFFGTRDVVSARLFFQRAADAGDGRGALHMGMTFDPAFLGRSGLNWVQADPAQAISWYRRASALGNNEAANLIRDIKKRGGELR